LDQVTYKWLVLSAPTTYTHIKPSRCSIFLSSRAAIIRSDATADVKDVDSEVRWVMGRAE